MKKLSALVLGLMFAAGSAQFLSAAQFGSVRERAQNRDRVCFYQDIQYQGWEQCYNAGDEIASLERRNDAVSSIRIYGRARVTVYDETEFRGRSAEFTADVPDLGRRNLSGSRTWSDHIESFRISSEGFFGTNNTNNSRNDSDRFPIQDRAGIQGSDGVCVYDRRDFQGRERCWEDGADVSDLARDGNWSDRISSIRVFGRAMAVLYRDVSYRGDSITIDRDISDLSQVTGNGFRSWDRQASSIVVESSRAGFPGRGRGRGRGRF
jgi:hypothetical protein